QYYVCYWPKENVSVEYYQTHKSSYDTLRSSIESALKSCLVNKIITPEEKKRLGDLLKEADKKMSSPGVTPTPLPLPFQTCPPPTITTFSPLVGNKGTILQINGTNLDYVSKIKLIDVEIDSKGFELLNKQTIRLTVPQIGTGNAVVQGKIELISPYGNYLTTQLFKYDPAIVNPAAASSPGGYAGNNQTSNANAISTNTQPQQTGAPTMIGTETKVVRNLTDVLTVSMSPNTPPATISTAVLMEVSVYSNTLENNVVKKTLVQTATSVRDNLVTNNVFKVTYSDVANLLINYPIPPFNTNPIKARDTVLLQFTLSAQPVDRVKYPQSTTQSFNFTFAEY
ncbi:hypothetical protein EB001_28005, partial [bacterium]|nr:hypothetical protein [bacterium]